MSKFWKIINCEFCGKERRLRRCDKRRFCNKSCSNAWQHAKGIRKIGFNPHKPWYEYVLEKHGKEYADVKMSEYKQTLSKAILAADMTHQKEVARAVRVNYNKSLRGKTLEEIHGIDKAREIRLKFSNNTKGEKNPAFGKVYQKGGRSVKGYYKGRFFRSLLEYSFIKHLENNGFSLNDIKQECFKVNYELNGVKRTYTIDFYIEKTKSVYEIKQSWVVKKNQSPDCEKWKAAKKFFESKDITFSVLTELDFKKVSFEDALLDADVVFIQSSLKSFTKK